jgi:hypothetical protein
VASRTDPELTRRHGKVWARKNAVTSVRMRRLPARMLPSMSSWIAILRVGYDLVEVSIDQDGNVAPVGFAVMRDEAIRRGAQVMLTATGPAVPLAVEDPPSTVMWLIDMFEVVNVLQDAADWPDDPRTSLPDGAVG